MMNVITNNSDKCLVAFAVLRNVMDPEIGLNIVDLGLIYQIDFEEGERKLFCAMTLTTQFCPMGESITNAVRETLQERFPGWEIIVELTFDPPWNHELISAAGLEFLNGK